MDATVTHLPVRTQDDTPDPEALAGICAILLTAPGIDMPWLEERSVWDSQCAEVVAAYKSRQSLSYVQAESVRLILAASP